MSLCRASLAALVLACGCTGSGRPSPTADARSPGAAAPSVSARAPAGPPDTTASAAGSASSSTPATAALAPDPCLGAFDVTEGVTTRACDAGFTLTRARSFPHCTPSDLLCAIRTGGWDHAPVHRAAPPDELVSCRQECDAGNAASCERVARAIGSGSACGARHRERACELGWPGACGETDEAQRETAKRSFARLGTACPTPVASWACFYRAHAVEMAFGNGLLDAKRRYAEVCAAKCPTEGRCYRDLACAIVRAGAR